MKKMIMIACTFLLSIINFSICCAPHEVVIIRHGDKWEQKNDGPYLSAKGQIRAEKFAQYYLKTFPKPNYIFSTRIGDNNCPNQSKSMRPLLTVIPLASELASLNNSKQ